MKPWQHILLGFLVGMIMTAAIILVSLQPQGNLVDLHPAPTTALILVDISGAIQNPGVYPLLPGSRLQDAVNAAGGLMDTADREIINLARLVHDGDKIFIPDINEEMVHSSEDIGEEEKASPTNCEKININTASINELLQLPGIGEVRAKQIIDYREMHGKFTAINEITNIPGIGEDTFTQIKDLIMTE